MANRKPNTSGLKPWSKGESGNKKGRPPKGRAFDDLTELIDSTPGALRGISKVWLREILKGNYSFFREYLDRSDGKAVPLGDSTEIGESDDLGPLLRVPTVKQAERKARSKARKAKASKSPKGAADDGSRSG